MAYWPPLVRWLGAIFGIGFCPFSGVKNRLLLGVFVVIKGGEEESPLTRSEVVVDRGVESGDRRGERALEPRGWLQREGLWPITERGRSCFLLGLGR
jgi:hypothetical protein